MEEKIFFYYTSDIHSHFDNWSKIIGFFNEKKEQRQRENQSYWLVDNGDHVDRFHPITEARFGKANVELLNHGEYDIATIGNNEGITLNYNDLFHLYDDANFQLVCANLQSIDGNNPTWLNSTYQLTTDSGIKVGVIGLTAPFNAYYNLLGWHVRPPFEVLDEHINALAEQTDVILLLSHLGITEDERIARRYPNIDVIIGGHTHHLFRYGEYVENTLLTAAGKHGKYVGEVILTWNHEQGKLVKKEAYTTNIDHLVKDEETEKRLQFQGQKADTILNRKIVTLDKRLEVDWFDETLLIKKLVQTLKEWTDADCALLNAGVLLDHLDAGAVSYGDVHRICPHPINPCTVKIKGNELLEVIRVTFTKAFMELELKGFGFRGKVIGRMAFSGLEVQVSKKDLHDYQVKAVTMNGSQLDRDKIYTVATADTFTFVNLLPEIARSKTKKYFMPEFLRDLLVDTLKSKI